MRLLALVTVFLILALWTAPVVAQPAGDRVPKILEAWKKRQTAFKTVKYVITGKVEHLFFPHPRPGMVGKWPKAPQEVSYKATVLLDCEKKRYRLELDQFAASAIQGGFVPLDITRAFDGSKVSSHIRNGKHNLGADVPDVSITKGSLSSQDVGVELWPIFQSHGIIPTAKKPLRPDKLPTEFNAAMFQFRGQLPRDGVPCAVLHSEPFDVVPASTDELWVDTSADAFIRRHVYYAGRTPFTQLDVKTQERGNARLPKEWTCAWFEGKRTRVIHRLRVESIESDFPVSDSDFRIAPKEGMIVEEHDILQPGSGLDPIKHGAKRYSVKANGKVSATNEQPQFHLDGSEEPLLTTFRWLRWLAGGATVLAGVAVFLRWQRRRNA